MLYSVSIMCYNRAAITRACLTTVLKRSPRDQTELILTDNGCTDETPRYLDQIVRGWPGAVVIHHRKNLGVIAAKNIALSRARGRYFVSLDNDCTVGPHWLSILKGPLESDPLVQQVGRAAGFCTLSKDAVGHRGERLDYIDGSCFMVRTDFARRFVLCDPAYVFAYCEDSDFSLRLRKAGWRIATTMPGVRHAEHQTAHHTGLNLRPHWERNHRLFLRRWGSYLKTREFGHVDEPPVRGGLNAPQARSKAGAVTA
jgi:GT2 family glycosyltransferase